MADFKLEPHGSIPKAEGPVLVCVLDGWGVNVEDGFNAVFSASTPITDALKANAQRYRTVRAHGTAVGLPSDADMGNSEVGHNALGSGQVIDQGARLVDIALETGSMFKLPGWKLISEAFAEHTVHFIGLLSDGGVHSRYNQLIGTIKGAVADGAKRIRVHALTDGRDVPDGSSITFMGQLQADLAALAADGVDAAIASGGGRMIVTMDRYEVRRASRGDAAAVQRVQQQRDGRYARLPGLPRAAGCNPGRARRASCMRERARVLASALSAAARCALCCVP